MESPVAVLGVNLRGLRAAAGVSLGELARRSSVSKTTLAQLESGRGNPTVETLWAIANALGGSWGTLIAKTEHAGHVVRRLEQPVIDSPAGTVRLIARLQPLPSAELFNLTVGTEPLLSDPHAFGVVEHVVVLQGSVSVGSAGAPEDREPGDYLTFPADQPHRYAARQSTAQLLVLVGLDPVWWTRVMRLVELPRCGCSVAFRIGRG